VAIILTSNYSGTKEGINIGGAQCYVNVFTGPPITSTSEQKAHLNGSEMATGPFVMKTPLLSTYSQQLWVIAKLSTSNNDGNNLNDGDNDGIIPNCTLTTS